METEQEICVLGDTNGNLAMVEHSLEVLGLIDQRRSWVGGAAHLVVMGDIRADRFPWGIAITDLLEKLGRQAVKHDGSVVRLVGNHDFDEADILLNVRYIKSQRLGFAEILKHLPSPPELPIQMHDPKQHWWPATETWVLSLINAHLKDPAKKAALLQLYRKKGWHISLAETPLMHTAAWHETHVLFTHVPPTQDMLEGTILNSAPCEEAADWMIYVNNLWQTRVLTAFEHPSEENADALEELAHKYTHPPTRGSDLDPSVAKRLSKAGISFAVHGHTTPAVRRQTIGAVEIFAVGSTAGIYRGAPMEAAKGLSIMIFGKDGQIHFGENAVRIYRGTYSA